MDPVIMQELARAESQQGGWGGAGTRPTPPLGRPRDPPDPRRPAPRGGPGTRRTPAPGENSGPAETLTPGEVVPTLLTPALPDPVTP